MNTLSQLYPGSTGPYTVPSATQQANQVASTAGDQAKQVAGTATQAAGDVASTAKQQAGKADLVTAELARLHEYLLAPLDIAAPPATLRQAIATYRAARRGWEQRLRCQVRRAAEQAVIPAVR